MNGASSLARATLLIAAVAGLIHGVFGLYRAFGGTVMLDTTGKAGASEDAQIRAFFVRSALTEACMRGHRLDR